MSNKSIHQIMGISDKREQEIAEEVLNILLEAGTTDEGIEKLVKTYDAEAMMVGIHMMAGIRLLWVIDNKGVMAPTRRDIGTG